MLIFWKRQSSRQAQCSLLSSSSRFPRLIHSPVSHAENGSVKPIFSYGIVISMLNVTFCKVLEIVCGRVSQVKVKVHLYSQDLHLLFLFAYFQQ